MQPDRLHLYTHAFRRWLATNYPDLPVDMGCPFPSALISSLEIQRQRLHRNAVRVLINDPGNSLTRWLVLYILYLRDLEPTLHWAEPVLQFHTRDEADAILHNLRPSDMPDKNFRRQFFISPARRPFAAHGRSASLVAAFNTTASTRPGDRFPETLSCLTGMVPHRNSLVIYTGNIRRRTRHFSKLYNASRTADSPYLIYDHLHPEQVFDSLQSLFRADRGSPARVLHPPNAVPSNSVGTLGPSVLSPPKIILFRPLRVVA